MKKTETKTNYDWSGYFLLTALISFFGWAFETVLMLFTTGKFHDRGFMTLPFCPIYGCSVITTYFLLGTPDEGRGLLKNVDNRIPRYLLYLLFAFLIPSLAELIVGLFFDKLFDVWLWSYNGMPLNVGGYVCLPVSVAWAYMIFFFMKLFFTPLKKLFGKMPIFVSRALAFAVLIVGVIDLAYNALQL